MRLTDEQAQYLQEVLGAWPMVESFQRRAEVAVVTPALGPDESALLKKILASIQLENFMHITSGEIPPAEHVLNFGCAGLESQWIFPSLSEMIGSGEAVQAKKKLTWSKLQQFQKEWRG